LKIKKNTISKTVGPIFAEFSVLVHIVLTYHKGYKITDICNKTANPNIKKTTIIHNVNSDGSQIIKSDIS